MKKAILLATLLLFGASCGASEEVIIDPAVPLPDEQNFTHASGCDIDTESTWTYAAYREFQGQNASEHFTLSIAEAVNADDAFDGDLSGILSASAPAIRIYETAFSMSYVADSQVWQGDR